MNYDGNVRIGVLGGGQLGRMMIQAGIPLDLNFSVLDPSDNSPCKSLAASFTQGDFKDPDAVYTFGQSVDIITTEIEHVSVAALEKLESEDKRVFPSSKILATIQDKGIQKQFLASLEIPIAEFILLEDKSALEQAAHFLPAFQKSRRSGYDGRGVCYLETAADIQNGFDVPSVLEKAVQFEVELSVIVARGTTGEVKLYPPTALYFHEGANMLDYLVAPAEISEDVQAQIERVAYKIVEGLNMMGVLAIEMFLTREGQVLVNELAPRPHNSGHHTIEANVTSQYEQHLRAITGMPLGATTTRFPAVMINLLGEPGFEGEVCYHGLDQVLKMQDVHVHLYGKRHTKPFRKMGHVTIIDKDIVRAKQKAMLVKKLLKVGSK